MGYHRHDDDVAVVNINTKDSTTLTPCRFVSWVDTDMVCVSVDMEWASQEKPRPVYLPFSLPPDTAKYPACCYPSPSSRLISRLPNATRANLSASDTGRGRAPEDRNCSKTRRPRSLSAKIKGVPLSRGCSRVPYSGAHHRSARSPKRSRHLAILCTYRRTRQRSRIALDSQRIP